MKVFSPFRIVLLFLVMAVTSVVILPWIKVNLLPVDKSNTLIVHFSIDASSPAITEQDVTSQLEGAFSKLHQLRKISSVSRFNTGMIELQFDKTADMQVRQFELAAIIRQVYPQLPQKISYPEISGIQSENEQVHRSLLIYTINAPEQPFQVRNTATGIFQKALAGYSGLQDIAFSGTPTIQLTIRFDLKKFEALQVQPEQIASRLKERFRDEYPGMIEMRGGEQLFLRIRQGETNIAAIEELQLINNRGQEYRLKDLAAVFLEEQPSTSFFRINGKNSITMTVTSRKGNNDIVLAKELKKTINEVSKKLPVGYDTRLIYDDTEYLVKELKKNYTRLTFSISILVLFILISYRSWRYLVTLFGGLLVNLCGCILLVWLLGIPVHLYTIAGLAVSFGIITDNAIVMLDYYHHFHGKKVFRALLAATCTTMAALSMIFLLQEEERKNLKDFAAIILIALTASLATVLWFIPGMYQLIFRKRQSETFVSVEQAKWFAKKRKKWYWQQRYYNFIRAISKWRKTFVFGLVLLFGIPIFMLPEKWENHEWYNRSIGSDWYQQKVKPMADKWFGGTLQLFIKNLYRRSIYRNPTRTKLFVEGELPFGNTPQQMNKILQDFEQFLSGEPGIDQYITRVSTGQQGNIEISFKETEEKTFLPYSLKTKLVRRSLNWTGVKWNIYGVGQGFNNSDEEDIPSFGVLLKGYNYDELEKQANALAQQLSQHPRVQKVNSNERLDYSERVLQEYVLNLDPRKLKVYNVTESEVMQQLQNNTLPMHSVWVVTINNQFYPVVIKEKDASTYSLYSLLEYPLRIDSVKAIKMKDISSLNIYQPASAIHKEDRQYIRFVSFEYTGSYHFGNIFLGRVLEDLNKKMPVGYSAEKKDWRDSGGTKDPHYNLLLLLLLINFIICSIFFENLKQSLIALSAIPVSFIGLFLIFYFGDYYFDQGGYAAFVMLGGLVVNSSIFIINDINNFRKKRNNPNLSLIRATAKRSRTILLTTISACCGFIPFLVGGESEVFWFSLAIGSLGGLVFSLFAVFVLLPVLMWKKRKS